MIISPHRLLSILSILCLSIFSRAQKPIVRAELDSMTIFVAGQVGLNVIVVAKAGTNLQLVQLPDSLGEHVEVVSALPRDTIAQGDLVQYMQRYIITSFDTGLHLIPTLPVAIVEDSEDGNVSLPELTLKVVNPFQQIDVDEQSGVAKIFDINNAEDAPFQWSELLIYWPWLVGIIIFLILLAVCVKLYLKYGRRMDNGQKVELKPDEPCEVIALRELERIRTEKLWQHNRVKDYYSELTDTLRRYISARFDINALESTSAELIEALQSSLKDVPSAASDLDYILSQADFVKFAKHEPLPSENDKVISVAVQFVENTTPTTQPTDSTTPENIQSQNQIIGGADNV